jgi:hypothetical protein
VAHNGEAKGQVMDAIDAWKGRAMGVIDEVAAERERQITVEGWTAQHDDRQHSQGELCRAAACYAMDHCYVWWPWDEKWWKPEPRRRALIKAAALIVAEIERLDRAIQAAE